MNILRILFFPFAFLYGLIVSIRNSMYDNGLLSSIKFELPVIIVGNLSTGGTGKTPMVEYLVRLLSSSHKTAVLSRGYKRKSRGFVMADSSSDAKTIGDEPLQYYKKFKNIQVAVDEDRKHGIEQLLVQQQKPEVIVLDDAFQHRRVKSECNILLTPYNHLYSEDLLLPTGNLREPVSGASRAQIIVVTKCPDSLDEQARTSVRKALKVKQSQQLFFTSIDYNDEIIGENRIPVKDLAHYEILVLTGIANPDPFLNFLTENNISFEHLKYADHHEFSLTDLDEINSVFNTFESNKKIILTTEKDYVRIFGRLKNLFYLPIKTSFAVEGEKFDELILNYVEQGTGNG